MVVAWGIVGIVWGPRGPIIGGPWKSVTDLWHPAFFVCHPRLRSCSPGCASTQSKGKPSSGHVDELAKTHLRIPCGNPTWRISPPCKWLLKGDYKPISCFLGVVFSAHLQLTWCFGGLRFLGTPSNSSFLYGIFRDSKPPGVQPLTVCNS